MMRWTIVCLFFFLGCKKAESQDLLQGLVGYYSFCGCNTNDHSGSENHASLFGMPECIQGINGEGFRFNVDNQTNDCGQPGGEYVLLPYFGAIWQDGITVCAWIQYENVNYYERIIDLGNGDGESGGLPIWFGREGNSNNLTLESWINSDPGSNRSAGRLVAQNVITNGQIELYGFTIAGDMMSIYVNGELMAQKRGHPILNVPRDHNYLGRSNWCYADPDFKGFMDEVRIYNRALTAEEMKLMYESPFQAGGDTSYQICQGEITQLQMRGGIAYEWSPSATLSALNIADPMAFPAETTTYEVEIFFPDGCSFVEEVTVEVFEDVQSNIMVEICEGGDYFGHTESGVYTDVFMSQQGCDSIRTAELTVLTSPVIDLDISICPGENYLGYDKEGIYVDTLQADGCDTIRTISLNILERPVISRLDPVAASCQKSDGRINLSVIYPDSVLPSAQMINGLSFKDSGLDLKALAAGEYHFRFVLRNGCSVDSSVVVPEEICPVYAPNAFSPNGDGQNDYFTLVSAAVGDVLIKDYVVFDRWGNLIYRAGNFYLRDGRDFWWDGKYKEAAADTGVYIYLVEILYADGVERSITGDVLVVH